MTAQQYIYDTAPPSIKAFIETHLDALEKSMATTTSIMDASEHLERSITAMLISLSILLIMDHGAVITDDAKKWAAMAVMAADESLKKERRAHERN